MDEFDQPEVHESGGSTKNSLEARAGPGFLGYLRLLFRHRYLLVGLSAGGAVVAVFLASLGPRQYQTEASFTPQQGMDGRSSRLSGMASQFGVDLDGGAPNQSPEFYRDLLSSREVLRAVLRARYPTPAEGDSARRSLLEIWELGDLPEADALDRGVRRLRESVSSTTSRETSMVRFTVTLRDPALAEAVAQRLLDQVNRFNIEKRQSRAAAERTFLEERVEQAREQLRAAEDSLKTFLQNNRSFNNSPELLFERNRLQRRVDRQQQLYTSLSQSLDEARINEIRNTPVITVVEGPEGSARPVPRKRAPLALVGLILGGTLGLLGALGHEYVRGARHTDPDDIQALSDMWQQTGRDIRQSVARLQRLFGGGRGGEPSR